MKQNDFANNFFEQATQITKAYNYDIILDKCKEQEIRIAVLTSNIEQLKIKLNGAEQRVKALQDFINEVRPPDATKMEMIETTAYKWSEAEQEEADELDNKDDIKDVL